MQHEWTHLVQRYISNINIFDVQNRGMAEFELALLGDIEEYTHCAGNVSLSNHSWACYTQDKATYKVEYLNWLSTLTYGGILYPSTIDAAKFRYFANIFGDISMAYNKSDPRYTYTNQTYNPVSITKMFKGCRPGGDI